MLKKLLPHVKLEAKPEGLKFKAPESAELKFDKTIRMAKATPTDIEIFGYIGEEEYGGFGLKSMSDSLKAAGKNPVNVFINSPGGDAFMGIALYNMLRQHSGRVVVNVMGIAASAASVIAMAGDTLKMGEASTLMIHSAWGIVGGNQYDVQEFAAVLNLLDNEVAGVYAARSGKTKDEVLALMKKETWMSGAQAVELGFADVAAAEKSKDKPKASLSAADRAALGIPGHVVVHMALPPGASGANYKPNPKDPNMNIQQQITAFEAKRAASAARRDEIQALATKEGRSKTEAEREEFKTISAEIQTIDEELVDLKAIEADQVKMARTVNPDDGKDPDAASKARAAAAAAANRDANKGVIQVHSNLAPGIAFARMTIALAAAMGNRNDAAQIFASNRKWMAETPQIHKVLMTAVPAADTTTSGWASELAYAENMASEFIEYLRPMTIIGRLTGIRRVPFNIRMGSLTGGTTGYWVGQGKPIPVSKGTTGSLSLGITKAAGIAAFDKELMRLSSPSVEIMVRDDLAKAVAQVADDSFINPNNGGLTNITPASVLYGVTPITPTGTTAAHLQADLASLFAAAIAANLDTTGAVLVMTPTTALRLSLLLTSLGNKQYPDITINGGFLEGLPVVVSQNALIAGSPQFGQMIVLLFPKEILLADDGGVAIDISDQTALEMLDNPTNTSTGSTVATSMVSMYQTESVAVKAVRYLNWVKRRSSAAAFIQAANYGS